MPPRRPRPLAPAGRAWLRASDLDETGLADFRAAIARSDEGGPSHEPRSYPGVPRIALPPIRPRALRSLDRTLVARRSRRALGDALPDAGALSRLLTLSHGVNATFGRGPTPSSGGLQSLELYLAVYTEGWLPRGLYHFDRAKRDLAQLHVGLAGEAWAEHIPSRVLHGGGALDLVLVSSAARICERYGERGLRFALLEAGHLMQNLSLLATSMGIDLLPLGGFCERAIATALRLPRGDEVMYVAVLGA